MALTATPANIQYFFTQAQSRFWESYDVAPVFTDKLATTIPVKGEVWLEGFLTMVQKYREWQGPRVVQNPMPLTYQVPIKNWENTQAINKFRFDDDSYGIYAPTFPFMGMQAKKLSDYQIRDALLNQGVWTGSFQNCLDGLSMFNTAHPVNYWDASQGTFANDYTAGGVTVNNQLIGGGISTTAFATVWQDMSRRKTESGEAWGFSPNLAFEGPMLKVAVDTVLQAQFLAQPQLVQLGTGSAGAVNGPMVGSTQNVMAAGAGWATNLMIPELSSSVAIGSGSNTYDQVWYLAYTDGPIKPIIWLLRQAPDFVARINPDDPVVFDKATYLYGSVARASMAWGFPSMLSRSGP